MRPNLQKPFNVHLNKQPKFHNYSNITKLEHERRERGFQVFISGANKERLKIRDLQQEVTHAKKMLVNTNITSTRKLKLPTNTFTRRKFWQKNSEIKIKGSDGSKFALQNQKFPKLDIAPHGSLLHDITTKTEFHLSAQKNSRLNRIRNRYKAYFHIDGYGFCCSKQTSRPSTPTQYLIDGTSPIFNRSSCKHLKRIQNRSISNSYSPPLYKNEVQKSHYYSLLDKNHEHISKLQEFSTPDYEYFQSAKESIILDPYKGDAYEIPHIDSCDGIVYDVFYHKEHNINRSARVLLPMNNQDENYYFKSNEGTEKEIDNVYFQNEPYLGESLPNKDVKEEEILFYQNQKAFVPLENQRCLNGLTNNNNRNEEIGRLAPLEKALSPIQLTKSSENHVEKMENQIACKHCSFLDCDDKSSSNYITNRGLTSRNVDYGKKSNLKLNFRYLYQETNYKIPEISTLDPIQLYVGDVIPTSSDDDGANQMLEDSTTNFSTSSTYSLLPPCTRDFEKLDSSLLMEEPCKNHVDFSPPVNNESKYRFPIFSNRLENITNKSKLLSARVEKLDIKKQIYLSHILDKLEMSKVRGSMDITFCQLSLQ